MSFKTTNKNKDLAILNKTIEDINLQILNDIKNYENSISMMLHTFEKRKFQSLSDSLSVIANNYQLKLARQKSFLQEHFNIAKALDIEMINKEYISEIEESIFMQDSMFEEIYSEDIEAVKNKQLDILQLPYYLRGYKVIEKEIELLNNRSLDSLELYDEEYAKVKIEINNLKLINADKSSLRVSDLFKNYGDFKAVLIDKPNNIFEVIADILSLYLYYFVFWFMGILFVLIRRSYLDYIRE